MAKVVAGPLSRDVWEIDGLGDILKEAEIKLSYLIKSSKQDKEEDSKGL